MCFLLMAASCTVILYILSRLVTLAIQNSALTLIMHHSLVSTPPSRAYSAATAVLLNEIFKGAISFIIAYARVDISSPHPSPYPLEVSQAAGSRWTSVSLLKFRKLSSDIFSPDCWKLSIPAILYGTLDHFRRLPFSLLFLLSVIQNNLQYVAASNLDAATFQVTYQMKILTTAGFSVLLLRKKLFASQWLALLCLAIGVGIVQIQAGTARTVPIASTLDVHTMNGLKGFLAVAAACFTSGLAGVYFEMVLKNSQADLWVRNVQLSLFSLLPALTPVFFSHASSIRSGADWVSFMFRNFGVWAWATVTVQVLGGLVTAMVIKYSDNILKGFATSLSVVISFLASVVLFNFKMTFTFILGSSVVLLATWLYNQPPGRARFLTPDSSLWTSMRSGRFRNHVNSNLSRSHTPMLLDPTVSSTRNLLPPSVVTTPHSSYPDTLYLEK
jgi:solute carrier family 35 (UDP-sugar transporter), member A1/2/3